MRRKIRWIYCFCWHTHLVETDLLLLLVLLLLLPLPVHRLLLLSVGLEVAELVACCAGLIAGVVRIVDVPALVVPPAVLAVRL